MSNEEKEDSQRVKELKAFFQFLKTTEIRIKEAACFNKRISYFRGNFLQGKHIFHPSPTGDEFLAVVEEYAAKIKEIMPETSKEYDFADEDSRMKFLQTYI